MSMANTDHGADLTTVSLRKNTLQRTNGAMAIGDGDRVALEHLVRYALEEAIDQGREFTAHLLDLAEQSLRPDRESSRKTPKAR